MKEFTVEAKVENLDKVIAFVNSELETKDCPMKIQMQIELAVEEIFVNIAHYAYGEETGSATVTVDVSSGDTAVICFSDSGVQYDPLAKEDPDVTLSVDKRSIGGLGIFMTKKSMDHISYEYRDGHNVLTMEKRIGVSAG